MTAIDIAKLSPQERLEPIGVIDTSMIRNKVARGKFTAVCLV
jgi:hypothetical protein